MRTQALQSHQFLEGRTSCSITLHIGFQHVNFIGIQIEIIYVDRVRIVDLNIGMKGALCGVRIDKERLCIRKQWEAHCEKRLGIACAQGTFIGGCGERKGQGGIV